MNNQKGFRQNQNGKNNMINQNKKFQNYNNNNFNYNHRFNSLNNNDMNKNQFNNKMNNNVNYNMNNNQNNNMNNIFLNKNMNMNNKLNNNMNYNMSNNMNYNMSNNMNLYNMNNQNYNMNINKNYNINNNMNYSMNNMNNKMIINNNMNNNINYNMHYNMNNMNNKMIMSNNMNNGIQNNYMNNSMNNMNNKMKMSNNMNNDIQNNYMNNSMNNMNNKMIISANNNNMNNLMNINMNNKNNININNNNIAYNVINQNKNNYNMNNINNNNMVNQFKINYAFLKNKNTNQLDKNNLNLDNNYKDFSNEIKLILEKTNKIFSQEKLSSLTTESDILSFFYEKEKECIDYIENSFGGYEQLKDYMKKQIEKIFKKNPIINHHITNNIYLKLKEIPIEKLESEKEYYEKLELLFGGEKIPEFLIEKDLKNLRCILFYMNRKNETTIIINKTRNREFNQENQRLFEFYERIRDNQIDALDGINKKYELLYLFITINNQVFHKNYCGEVFFSFLQANEQLIKDNFGHNIEYEQIIDDFRAMNKDQENNKKENLFNLLDNDINGNIDKIYNIIASFYCLLLYEFKDVKLYNNISNIGNALINLLLKNFVIFLDKKYRYRLNLSKNLFEYLNDLYIFDVNFLVNKKFYPSMNKTYSFVDIDSILMNNNIIGDNYKNLKIKFSRNQNNIDGVFTLIGKNIENFLDIGGELNKYENNIKLLPVDWNVYSNTITILVDALSIGDQNELVHWNNFINSFKKETMFYLFKWPGCSKNILLFGPRNEKENNIFISAKKRAKICGKMLAYILLSSEFFNNYQINLVGFSLGNHLIKHCLKELNKINNYNNFVKIKNVIFIGAATHIKNENIWKQFIEDIIVDRFINCYSKQDIALYMLYSFGLINYPEGNKPLVINNDNGENLVINYDFTQNNYNYHSYKFEEVANRIFEYYKDI